MKMAWKKSQKMHKHHMQMRPEAPGVWTKDWIPNHYQALQTWEQAGLPLPGLEGGGGPGKGEI